MGARDDDESASEAAAGNARLGDSSASSMMEGLTPAYVTLDGDAGIIKPVAMPLALLPPPGFHQANGQMIAPYGYHHHQPMMMMMPPPQSAMASPMHYVVMGADGMPQPPQPQADLRYQQ